MTAIGLPDALECQFIEIIERPRNPNVRGREARAGSEITPA